MQLFTSLWYIITLLVLFKVERMICSGKKLLSRKNTAGEINLTEMYNARSPIKYAEVEIKLEDNKNDNHSVFDYFERERMANRILLYKFIKDMEKTAQKKHSKRYNKPAQRKHSKRYNKTAQRKHSKRYNKTAQRKHSKRYNKMAQRKHSKRYNKMAQRKHSKRYNKTAQRKHRKRYNKTAQRKHSKRFNKTAHRKHSKRYNKRTENYSGVDEFDINSSNLPKLKRIQYVSESSEYEIENNDENQNNKRDTLKQKIEELFVDYLMLRLEVMKKKMKEINND